MDEVVPTVATKAHAPESSCRSFVRIRNSESTGTFCTASPSSLAAFSTDECACSEHSTTRPGNACRAAARAARVEVDAVSSMCPCHSRGSPSSWASQSIVTTSSSVAAGEARQRIWVTFRVAASSSARIPGSEPVVAK